MGKKEQNCQWLSMHKLAGDQGVWHTLNMWRDMGWLSSYGDEAQVYIHTNL